MGKRTKTAEDFYAAGRSISGIQNGIAISGDYMSAASLPRHHRAHRALRLRRLPLLRRLPRRVPRRPALRGRAAAQLRQVHDGRRARLPAAPAPGAHGRGDLDADRVRSSTCWPRWPAPVRWSRCSSASPSPSGKSLTIVVVGAADDHLRAHRRDEGHDVGADHQGGAAHRRHPDHLAHGRLQVRLQHLRDDVVAPPRRRATPTSSARGTSTRIPIDLLSLGMALVLGTAGCRTS